MLGMPFLTMSNTDVDFLAGDIQWKSYTNGDILLTIKQVELKGKKEFAAAVFNLEYKIFVVYIAVLRVNSGDEMHPLRKAQIAHLKANKALIKVFSKYANFVVFFHPSWL